MNSSDEPPLCRFGTPLDPLEEDDVPSKKRIAIEDQIVTDENGKRRFHGAFTGGFSAGFWNTVGSLEGWKPQSFKSSRGEKAKKRQSQLPTDFMDDEDLGEFGIAPQRVQARKDFATSDESSNRKRKIEITNNGPIPGVPVLQQLLEPSREKVAVRLLRRMGWKPGQGIGARQTKKEKARSNERNSREIYVMKIYGCAMQPNDQPTECSSNDTSDLSDEEDLTFAPDDFEPFVCCIKDNRFGLGYSGLGGQLASDAKTHINLFGPLEIMGKSNKKLSIRGQAFGVGALEEEDEDIYAKDDMSKYDFSLSDRKKRDKQKLIDAQDLTVIEGFAEVSGKNSNVQKTVHSVDLLSRFQPRNWSQRKTRFEPLPDDKIATIQQNDIDKKKGLGRHNLGPNERRNIFDGVTKQNVEIKEQQKVDNKKSYLQHITEKYQEREEKNKKILELLSSKADNFVKGGLITNSGIETFQEKEVAISEEVKSQNSKLLSEAKKITKSLGSSGVFRPFATNEGKQERYEKFIASNLKKEEDIKEFLNTIQPVHLPEWDREMERKEFIQARSIYKPLDGLMSERFVSKSSADVSKETLTKQDDKNRIVTVNRTKNIWKPSAVICKRFNIPEPFGGTLNEIKAPKKNKFSVFDYIENSINSKSDFVTPVIIPKHIEKPKEIKTQSAYSENVSVALPEENVFQLNSNSIPASKSTFKESVPKTDSTQSYEADTKDSKKNKTELELRIEESRNMHPSEKKDLFMSIFDSSSDDEDDDKKDAENTLEIVLTEEIVKTLIKPSAAPINALRNNSPPRGIFAALFLNSAPKEAANENVDKSLNVDKITFKPKHERHTEEVADPDDTYGPKIPTKFATQGKNLSKDEAIDKKLAELLSSKNAKGAKVVEKWVEKSGDTSRMNKKSKKEKKSKDRRHDREKIKKHKKHKKNKK